MTTAGLTLTSAVAPSSQTLQKERFSTWFFEGTAEPVGPHAKRIHTTDWWKVMCLTVRVEGYCVLRCKSPAIPNAIAALLPYIRDRPGKIPDVYFGWTEGNPVLYLLKFLVFGEGDTAPVTREALRQAEADPMQRPWCTSVRFRKNPRRFRNAAGLRRSRRGRRAAPTRQPSTGRLRLERDERPGSRSSAGRWPDSRRSQIRARVRSAAR